MNRYVFAELGIGMAESMNIVIEQKDVDAFMALSGDVSTVHVDDDYAKSRGFRQRLVHGVLIEAYISSLIGMKLPGMHGVLRSLDCQFRQPVYAPAALVLMGRVERLVQPLRLAQIAIKVSEADRGTLVTAVAETVLKQ
jgi:3-hydroxybutyryl-CoA dehydratase